jgi:hypothetical protein
MSRSRALLPIVLACPLFSCQSLARFDTKNGAAYCGSMVGAQFISTPKPPVPSPESDVGFQRLLRLRLEIDTDHLTTVPGKITTDDGTGPGGAADSPCVPQATFENASLRVTPEIVHDTLSTMTFEDGQIQNIMAWVDSTCRGPMLAVVSLMKNDHVDVRLLKPAIGPPNTTKRDSFALFSLDRQDNGCGSF